MSDLLKSDLNRFNSKVMVRENGCLEWTGPKDHGYGILTLCHDGHQFTRKAHRLAYEHYVGPIPAGLTLDHLCRNRACVNER